MGYEEEDRNTEQDEPETRREVPHRTGGQAEGERDDEEAKSPVERKRPSQAEG